jgi:hypothetical protein
VKRVACVLKQLRLDNNRLYVLPDTLGGLHSLTALSVEGNCLGLYLSACVVFFFFFFFFFFFLFSNPVFFLTLYSLCLLFLFVCLVGFFFSFSL